MSDFQFPVSKMPSERSPRITGNPLAWGLALVLLEAAGFLGYGSYVGETLLARFLVGHMAVACAIASVLVLQPGRREV